MSFRYALRPFVEHPERHPQEVLFYDTEVTIIWDKYPKSAIHLLILPRNRVKTKLTPIEAFEDEKFRSSLEKYIKIARALVKVEFGKKFQARDESSEENQNQNQDQDLGQNQKSLSDNSIIVLCHAVPSLYNLHIHVLTNDFVSPCVKNKKHFLSFQEPFGIPIEKFPLVADDQLRDPKYCHQLLKANMKWRGKDYGSRFAVLQSDLATEFNKHWERTPLREDPSHDDETDPK